MKKKKQTLYLGFTESVIPKNIVDNPYILWITHLNCGKKEKFYEPYHKIAGKPADYREKTIVFGEGAEAPLLMMIGEAPGGDEEKQGRPFVGKAGKNLSAFLEVVGLKREEIYISNVVKLRPTKESPKTGKAVNRPPSAEEIVFFLPFLQAEIQTIAPKVLVTLGNVPLKAVTGEKKAVIGDYHGRPVALADGRILFALYHPAAVIYNRALQAVYDADLLELKAFLQKEGLL